MRLNKSIPINLHTDHPCKLWLLINESIRISDHVRVYLPLALATLRNAFTRVFLVDNVRQPISFQTAHDTSRLDANMAVVLRHGITAIAEWTVNDTMVMALQFPSRRDGPCRQNASGRAYNQGSQGTHACTIFQNVFVGKSTTKRRHLITFVDRPHCLLKIDVRQSAFETPCKCGI